MGGGNKAVWAVSQETVRCRKLILGRDIECRCATSWCDLDLTFNLSVVTLTYKVLFRLYLGHCKL